MSDRTKSKNVQRHLAVFGDGYLVTFQPERPRNQEANAGVVFRDQNPRQEGPPIVCLRNTKLRF